MFWARTSSSLMYYSRRIEKESERKRKKTKDLSCSSFELATLDLRLDPQGLCARAAHNADNAADSIPLYHPASRTSALLRTTTHLQVCGELSQPINLLECHFFLALELQQHRRHLSKDLEAFRKSRRKLGGRAGQVPGGSQSIRCRCRCRCTCTTQSQARRPESTGTVHGCGADTGAP